MLRINQKLIFLGVLFACSCEADQYQDNNPGIVFILLDDVRWDDIHGSGFVEFPNFERVMNEGAYFHNFFITFPLCSPSRASFLTGQYAFHHGIIDNGERSKESHQLQTFPMRFENNNYETAFIGKWHMGHKDSSPRPGFSHWVSFVGQGEYFDPTFNVNGERLEESGYVTDILNQQALQFLENCESPFLLYLSHKAVHPEIHSNRVRTFPSAARHREIFENITLPSVPEPFQSTEGKPALERPVEFDDPRSNPMEGEDILNRLRMLKSVDEGIGDILDILERKGTLDETVFIVTSDQGFFYGEFGLGQERRLAYEPSIRIPFLIRYPPLIKAGTEIEATGLNIDVAPTLLDLCNIPIPEQMDGISLVPVLSGGPVQEEEREGFLIEYYSDEVFPRVNNMGYKAIRTGRYKFIKYNDLKGMDEFYDLEEDPFELKNEIDNPVFEQKINELSHKIMDHLSKNKSLGTMD